MCRYKNILKILNRYEKEDVLEFSQLYEVNVFISR